MASDSALARPGILAAVDQIVDVLLHVFPLLFNPDTLLYASKRMGIPSLTGPQQADILKTETEI